MKRLSVPDGIVVELKQRDGDELRVLGHEQRL
jgi:hypothetical protein